MEMLTIDELAGRLKVHTRTIRRLIQRGHLPAPVKLGHGLRWPEAQIQEWISRGCPRANR